MRYLIALLLLFNPMTALATDYSADANCMGYWPMEEGLGANGDDETDGSGEGGTLIETDGDIPNSADKAFGDYSRDFEVGDYEYMYHADGNSTDISGADQKLSIVVSTKREGSSHSANTLVSKYNTSSQRSFWFAGYTYADIRCYLSNDGSSTTYADAGTDSSLGSWDNWAVVYDDTDIRIYLDGSLDNNGSDNPKTYSAGLHNSSATFRVGDRDTSGSTHWDGLIDEVAVFDRALTSVEVSDIDTNGIEGSEEVVFQNITTGVMIF